ncbi:FIG007317: Chromosome segregation protein SMC-like, partial [hydrothermal vent metagenome]
AAASGPDINLHPQSLCHKLVIKPDCGFYSWLERELARRFDYACTESMAQFQRERQAVTRAGQIKSGGRRHEKDDRYKLTDRGRYILGWTNEQKIAALSCEAGTLSDKIGIIDAQITKLQTQLHELAKQRTTLAQLGEFRHFDDLDWQSIAKAISRLEQEQLELESASNILRALNRQLSDLEKNIALNETEADDYKRRHAKNDEKRKQAENLLGQSRAVINRLPEAGRQKLVEELRPLQDEALGSRQLTVESCDNCEREMREWLQKKIDSKDRRLKTLSERIIRAMQDFCREFPLETREIDVDLLADSEYIKILEQLKADDLPRFARRFKELLNENTIREIANFQSHLNKERRNIKERIEIINRSLADIEYNPGRYIVLEAQASPDQEITVFRQQLRACTEGALTGSEDEQYAENKFLQVKDIIDRFRGREGTSDLDKNWRNKVTDVRRWFEFAASERWQEDDSEYEHYTDSSGKSGGEKEKLAYTVLAAGLAYQFGLEWGAVRSRSFRFVVIDEAFGRGSDESARYGLKLFKKLNLQLLIVTPLQKIHIIEPFVNSVGFVHNEEGRESFLRNLTIEEYKIQREACSA